MITHQAYHTLEVYDPITGCYMVAVGEWGEYEPASIEVAHEIAAAKYSDTKYRIVSVIEVDCV